MFQINSKKVSFRGRKFQQKVFFEKFKIKKLQIASESPKHFKLETFLIWIFVVETWNFCFVFDVYSEHSLICIFSLLIFILAMINLINVSIDIYFQ